MGYYALAVQFLAAIIVVWIWQIWCGSAYCSEAICPGARSSNHVTGFHEPILLTTVFCQPDFFVF